ncbi:MAG: hypothetical protein IPJ31_08345 [Bacteroidetes bacterium]|nr:hypothetical protein [Bacteroidota bacterium]
MEIVRTTCTFFQSLCNFSETPVQNMQGKTPYGLGLSYEFFANKNISVQTPLFFALNSDYKKFALTCKIYPNNGGVVKYAACPTLFMSTHKISDYYYNDYGFAEPQIGRSEQLLASHLTIHSIY